jgi:hypothetical protein
MYFEEVESHRKMTIRDRADDEVLDQASFVKKVVR